jgi:nitrite reductase (NO-forming)
VRIWVLDAGPERSSAFHIVGTQFDTVFKEGASQLRPDNAERGGAQVLDLAPAQGCFVELSPTSPGTTRS